jgi:hypothetical protein
MAVIGNALLRGGSSLRWFRSRLQVLSSPDGFFGPSVIYSLQARHAFYPTIGDMLAHLAMHISSPPPVDATIARCYCRLRE